MQIPPIAIIASVCLLIGPLPGCATLESRVPVPAALVGRAQPVGFGPIRSWGDETSPPMQAAVVEQYREVKRWAIAGAATRHADFLAISGGGGDGAYAAGVLKGWSERGSRPVFEVVTGVSTGALAAPFAFLGSNYDNVLADIYETHADGDLYTSNGPIGLVGPSLRDTAPLKRLIRG